MKLLLEETDPTALLDDIIADLGDESVLALKTIEPGCYHLVLGYLCEAKLMRMDPQVALIYALGVTHGHIDIDNDPLQITATEHKILAEIVRGNLENPQCQDGLSLAS